MTDKYRYLYRIQPVRPAMLSQGPTPEEQDAVGRHFLYLQELTRQGVVLLAGRTTHTDPSSFGLVIFAAEGDEEARALMEGDPAVREEVFRAELFPFGVALLAEL